jgi:hypothetical protein
MALDDSALLEMIEMLNAADGGSTQPFREACLCKRVCCALGVTALPRPYREATNLFGCPSVT